MRPRSTTTATAARPRFAQSHALRSLVFGASGYGIRGSDAQKVTTFLYSYPIPIPRLPQSHEGCIFENCLLDPGCRSIFFSADPGPASPKWAIPSRGNLRRGPRQKPCLMDVSWPEHFSHYNFDPELKKWFRPGATPLAGFLLGLQPSGRFRWVRNLVLICAHGQLGPRACNRPQWRKERLTIALRKRKADEQSDRRERMIYPGVGGPILADDPAAPKTEKDRDYGKFRPSPWRKSAGNPPR